MREAAPYVQVNIAATGYGDGFRSLPPREGWALDPRSAYVHYTPNETIGGVEFPYLPETGDVLRNNFV